MSTLWKNGSFATDSFVAVDDTSALPRGRPLIVSLERWRNERETLLQLGQPIGLTVSPTATLVPATDALDGIATVVIPFVKFTDGRGYSLARRLRDEFNYRGEIRATGEVLLDQLPLMLRCGFDAFVVGHEPTRRALVNGHLPAITEVYQPAARIPRGRFVRRTSEGAVPDAAE